ncbi:MAG: tRNA (adenosine(37)-N6)-dimethylallyltransferase MiaA [Clostridia bacterium]|nr:tRNA (adenosine(37)-N6)-dimethylallyltransferase MiaA [Clostridia bacterium]
MKKVIIIFGPTGVGKTKLSIELAKELNGEIISADSMQIYKDMNIGTAKITVEEMENIPHHLIDIKEPNEEYSVGEFVQDAKEKITEITARKKVPIIVGGTGLYIRALVEGYDFFEVEKNNEIREKYQKLIEEKGNEFVYNILKEKDIEWANKLHPNNIKRIIRALEIIEINEKSLKNTEKMQENSKNNEINLNYLIFGLNMDREKLYERINFRVEKMFKEGLINEVKTLLETGIKKDSQSMQGIGYKEVIEGLDNNLSESDIMELIKQHTRNYAKRQFTFMRGIKDLIWIEAGESEKENIFKKVKD